MAINREAYAEVTCDTCGLPIIMYRAWIDDKWLHYFAQLEGAKVDGTHTCKTCCIKECKRRCTLIKEQGTPGAMGLSCLGFRESDIDDTPCKECKQCIACVAYDWALHRRQVQIRMAREK